MDMLKHTCKSISGLSYLCKVISGLKINCKLISGRDSIRHSPRFAWQATAKRDTAGAYGKLGS
jgi:hypothetical protein